MVIFFLPSLKEKKSEIIENLDTYRMLSQELSLELWWIFV